MSSLTKEPVISQCRGSEILQFFVFSCPTISYFFNVLSLEMVCILSKVCLQFSEMKKETIMCAITCIFEKKFKEARKGFNTKKTLCLDRITLQHCIT